MMITGFHHNISRLFNIKIRNIYSKILNLFLFKLAMEKYQILLVINPMNKMKMVIPLQ